MLIKRLYEDGDLNIERILTKEQKRLKLSTDELVVLLAFFSIYKKRNFSVRIIARRVEFDDVKIGKLVDKLIEKSFIQLELENKDGKEREVFDLTNTFNKIEELYLQDIKEEKLSLVQSELGETINLLQRALPRELSASELDLIRSWYQEDTFKHQRIIEEINKHGQSPKFSIKYLQRVLIREQHQLSVQPDEEVDQALNKIFSKLK